MNECEINNSDMKLQLIFVTPNIQGLFMKQQAPGQGYQTQTTTNDFSIICDHFFITL